MADDPIAFKQRTVAVLETDEGVNVVAGGGRDLSPAQRALQSENEVLARLPGQHAEITAIKDAQARGLTPKTLGTSRDICSECQQFIIQSGGSITGPRSARWP